METGATSVLEALRTEMGFGAMSVHRPVWSVREADERFVWFMDGERAVALLDRAEDVFELRCHGPDDACAVADVPKYYHVPAYTGVRIIYTWRLNGRDYGEQASSTTRVSGGAGAAPVVCTEQRRSDGTRARSEIRLRFDPAWGAYVADVETVLDARRVTTALEYCNVLPAGIGDSRPGRERHPFTYWQQPQGLRKMLKNPLWFVSVGAQDLAGEKRIAPGGFIGFGPDPALNPVVEVVDSDPGTGATTCDNLQDEHIMALPAEGRHATDSGWFHLSAQYRLFSIPPAMAEALVQRAEPMTPGAMLAWKFQYPPTSELPMDLHGVALPGSPFYGTSDWSEPIPWDRAYNGRLWTASPDPAAAIHYDRAVGRAKPGSIRIRVEGECVGFAPGSGHTLFTEKGKTYRCGVWVKAEGNAAGWVEAWEVLFRRGDRACHSSARVQAGRDWTYVETTLTGQGDEAPFADTVLCAEGDGNVWFADLVFEEVAPE